MISEHVRKIGILGKKGDSEAARTVADALRNRVTSVMPRVICQVCVEQELKHITSMNAPERSQPNGLFLFLFKLAART